MSNDAHWMRRAVELAHRGHGRTAPNPSVGAVLLKDGVVIGEGHTRPVGGAHGERVAMANARDAGHDLAGATLYVTLEPCCHHGRTPPCTDGILEAGIARVVVGVIDPNPPMRGHSLELLRAAGVEVVLGVEAEASARSLLGFTRSVRRGLPEVTLKAATTLDGHIATANGESQWITGELARADGHLLRATHDAIVVGINTALADNPRLTCRTVGGADPVPVVLDSGLRLPETAALLSGTRRALILCATDAPERELPADVVRIPRSERGLDVTAALRVLAERGLHRVLVEGGGQVHRSLLDAGHVDTVVLYLAGLVLPGGRPWVGGASVSSLGEQRRWGRPDVRVVGDDVRLQYTLSSPAAALHEEG